LAPIEQTKEKHELTGLVRAVDGKRGGKPFCFWSVCFSPNGKPFTARSVDPFRFVFEKERVKVKRGARGGEPLAPIEQTKEKHDVFEIVHQNGLVQMSSDAVLEATTREVERLTAIPEQSNWRFHRPPTVKLDWRQLAKLHARGALDEFMRRRGLV
jgi:hypothetical protein